MSLSTSHTYRLALRPTDEHTSSAELMRTAQRVLLSLDARGVSIVHLRRPPLQDAQGLYVEAVAAGPEDWYRDVDDALLAEGLRSELQP
ncbi:hypothetical protein MWN52_08595 [Pseudoxanthomonas winnipegensis]|uniref:hypothetical protein n=1 Tax=Pseudoxanthomonas winnipegensis TaxID=2480810 RepID=UPI002578F47D|nr:hypothetical protein [Pseudoxanthomonas winnipegensis]WJI17281.1 hypothetical protein MWN52_08595 [Pseudoxanthomonas winnipegensis]